MKSKRQVKITPSKKVVLIEMVDISPTYKSDIQYVTEKKQETGKVIAIGAGARPVAMKKGDTIAFRRYGEDKLFIDGREFLFVTFPDILGVVK